MATPKLLNIESDRPKRRKSAVIRIRQSHVYHAAAAVRQWNNPAREPIRLGHAIIDVTIVTVFAAVASSAAVNKQAISFSVGWLILPLIAAAISICVVSLSQSVGVYRSTNMAWSPQLAALTRCVFIGTAAVCASLYLLHAVVPLGLIFAATAISFAVPASTIGIRTLTRKRACANHAGLRRALIVGDGARARAVRNALTADPSSGYEIVGLIDQRSDGDGASRLEELPVLARRKFADEIFIALPWGSEEMRAAVQVARGCDLTVHLVPELQDDCAWGAALRVQGRLPVATVYRPSVPAIRLLLKRWLDVAVSGLCLIGLSPIMLVIAIAIKLDSPGPVLYRSPRIGHRGNQFSFLKFRTMVQNADGLKAELRARNERQGPFFKMANDPRVTRTGKFLRKYSLDELPQLWNVLRGDMSLVGPRPHPVDDVALYRPEYLRRLDVMPGITGLWQVTARRDPSWDKNMALDLEYIENWNLRRDLTILCKTVPAVFQGDGQ